MGTSNAVASRGASKSPKKAGSSPHKSPKTEPVTDAKVDKKSESKSDGEATKPLAPPPKPGQQQQNTNTPDYFSNQASGSLSLEPNPFEQSFGVGGPETPGGTKLPSVAALTSPSSLLPGGNATPFNWGGGSLRTGPLSPAMLSGPQSDYFGDTHHLRGGFPTPNESSLRSGLTPGGSGSMFPAASPNSQALFAQLASGGATPSTLDFHRTALSAASKREGSNARDQKPKTEQQNQQQPEPKPATISQQEMSNGASVKTEPRSGPFDPHDNDAANGLFMLAQGRNGAQNGGQYTATSAASTHGQPDPVAPGVNGSEIGLTNGISGGSARDGSEASGASDGSEQLRPTTRNKGKRNPPSATTNGRRKAEEPLAKPPPHKKTKSVGSVGNMDMDIPSDEDDMIQDENGNRTKMTEDEKRKNFLERNRVAALKCRQRKKQWLANLQSKVEMFSSENDALTAQITQLREEVVNLKTLLLAHKDCPVTQQQGLHGAFMSQVVEPYNTAQMNPYGMAAQMSNQAVMAGQQRRFS